jgi:superfamily II DNA or RNA helicase
MSGSLSTRLPIPSNTASSKSNFGLRPYQIEAVDAIIRDFSTGSKKVGCILPTGAGKTEIMLSVADRFLRHMAPFGAKVLVLSHMGLLVGQTSDRAAIRIPERKIGWLRAGTKPNNADDIIVGTMQSARIDYKLEHITGVMLIIVDEAHFITSDSYKKITDRFCNAYILGLTATPFKAKKLMTNQFDKVSYCASLQDMITQGYLVPPKLIGFESTTDDYTADVAALYRTHELNSKTLVFMPTVAEAVLMTKVFEMEGIKAATIVGTTLETTRARHINAFQTGDLNVLVTVDVLTAGFDAPCTEVIIMPVRCGSPTTFMQRVGRGLRRYKEKKECRVYFFGKVPKLEQEFYEKLQKFTFNAKPEKLDIFEKLEWAKYENDSDEIIYCENMARIHKSIKSMSYDWFADVIRNEKLGKDLMGRIDVLHDKLRHAKIKPSEVEASPKQKAYIESMTGLKIESSMKISEAGALIGVLIGEKQPNHPFYGKQWTVPTGKFATYHIKDVPWVYTSFCLANAPKGEFVKLFHKWKEYKKENTGV